MATTQTGRPASKSRRSLDSLTRWLLLAWVAVGFIYFVTHTGRLDPSLMFVWLGVQAVLTVAHVALGVVRPR